MFRVRRVSRRVVAHKDIENVVSDSRALMQYVLSTRIHVDKLPYNNQYVHYWASYK